MKKLALTLDHLEVDTFVAGSAAISPGTVRAHDTFPQPSPAEDAVAPAPCPSNVSGCYTGSAPNCCV